MAESDKFFIEKGQSFLQNLSGCSHIGWTEVMCMNACELTASVTALANAMACQFTDDELTLLASVLVQLGDTLVTIVTRRSLCEDGKS